MGSKTSRIAKQVAKSQQRAISPRERMEKMPSLSSGAASLRHNRGAVSNDPDLDNMTEEDKFRNEWFPNAHWEQYPVRGDIEEMAKAKPAHAPIRPDPDPVIPHLAEEKDNQDLIRDLTFIGKGLTPGPDKSTQFPRLWRDETKMPKQRISLPEKKLKGYLDADQFKEIYEISANYSIEELAIKFETQEKKIEEIFKYTSWVQQPASSTLQDPAKAAQDEERKQREQVNAMNAARLHKPNQGGRTPYESGHGVPE